MPLSQSTPLHLWAFSLEHGVWLWRNSGLTSANLADVISEFMSDHADGVIVAIVADPTDAEIALWEERVADAYWEAKEAQNNESPSVTALNDALDILFGAKPLIEDGLDIQPKCEDYPCCGCCTISDDGWNGYIYE